MSVTAETEITGILSTSSRLATPLPTGMGRTDPRFGGSLTYAYILPMCLLVSTFSPLLLTQEIA